MLALFERYPVLKEKLPHVALGDFPTPVEKLERLAQAIHAPQLYVKRDDVSGKPYGGNKVRALDSYSAKRSARDTSRLSR